MHESREESQSEGYLQCMGFCVNRLVMLRLKTNEVKNMQIISLLPQYPGYPPNLPMSKTKDFFVDAQ